MPMLESEIEQRCVKIAKDHNCILLKIQKATGYPDRLLLSPKGKMMFMELKRPGGTLRPLQQHILLKLQHMGYPAQMIDSVDQFKLCLQDLLVPPGNLMDTKNGV